MNFRIVNFLIVFVISIGYISCSSNSHKGDELVRLDSLKSMELRIAILDDTSLTKRPWIPTYNQLKIIDSIVAVTVNNKNPEFSKHLKPDSIDQYYRQYIFDIDTDGDSVVNINALYYIDNDEVDRWQNDLILVKDGGDAFWQIKINYSKRKCTFFSVNGYAMIKKKQQLTLAKLNPFGVFA